MQHYPKIQYLKLYIFITFCYDDFNFESKDVSLYLLDEPESFLDTDAKKKVIDFLMMKKSDRMIIIVSHDKDIIQCADEVIDLDESR